MKKIKPPIKLKIETKVLSKLSSRKYHEIIEDKNPKIAHSSFEY